MNSEKRVALVTGASRGIGKVIARELAKAGHLVYGSSRNWDAGVSDGVFMTHLDVCSDASVQQCVDQVLRAAGRIDVLVNNAGFDLYGAFEETSVDEFAEQMDTNFMGAVRMVRAVLPHMRKEGKGQIIQIGSLGGRIGLPMNSAYAASKFALEGFTESLRLELLATGIYTSIVVPGAVATDTLDESIREVRSNIAVYAARKQRLVNKMRADGAASSVRPIDVAHAVVQLTKSKVPPPSVSVGLQAKMVPLMKATLPGQAFELVMKRLFP